MSDDNIPRIASPSVRFHFRKAAKALDNSLNPLDTRETNTGKTKGDVQHHSKSSAQVATSVEQKIVQRKSGGLKPGKSKPFHIGIRLSQNEREIVVQQAQKSCLTISEYVRASVLGAGYISLIDPVKRELLQNISRELGRQGTNLNQIAKHLNAGVATPEQGDSMLAILGRSLLSAHKSVRHALAEGRDEY